MSRKWVRVFWKKNQKLDMKAAPPPRFLLWTRQKWAFASLIKTTAVVGARRCRSIRDCVDIKLGVSRRVWLCESHLGSHPATTAPHADGQLKGESCEGHGVWCARSPQNMQKQNRPRLATSKREGEREGGREEGKCVCCEHVWWEAEGKQTLTTKIDWFFFLCCSC